MRGVCVYFNAELIELNGEADHVHVLMAYPPTVATSVLAQRLKRPHRLRGPARVHRCVSAPAYAATSGRRPTSPSPAEARPCRSLSNTSTDKPDDIRDGLTPGLTPEVHGSRPRIQSP